MNHKEHLISVFQILRSNSLTTNRSKCVFAASQVEYLGHIISRSRVATDPSKIGAVKE
jgi:hypothetical protein